MIGQYGNRQVKNVRNHLTDIMILIEFKILVDFIKFVNPTYRVHSKSWFDFDFGVSIALPILPDFQFSTCSVEQSKVNPTKVQTYCTEFN